MIPGANAIGILLIATKMLSNLSPCVDHSMASTTTTAAVKRPINTSLASGIAGRRRLTISSAVSVAVLFSAASIVLINAAKRPAAIRPLTPTGSSSCIITIKVLLLLSPILSAKRT